MDSWGMPCSELLFYGKNTVSARAMWLTRVSRISKNVVKLKTRRVVTDPKTFTKWVKEIANLVQCHDGGPAVCEPQRSATGLPVLRSEAQAVQDYVKDMKTKDYILEEPVPGFGRIDVGTKEFIIEVKHVLKWYEGFGQLMAYDAVIGDDRELELHLFHPSKHEMRKEKYDNIKHVLAVNGIALTLHNSVVVVA